MGGDKDESRIGPHHVTGVLVNPEVPMSSLKEQLEALRFRNGNGSRSQVDETNPLAGADLTNLLLLELLQKQGEQLEC